jgi:hypothetical protein
MNQNSDNNFASGSQPQSQEASHVRRAEAQAAARRRKLDRLLLERDIDAVLDRDADEHTEQRVNAALQLDAALRHDFNATRDVIARLANPPRTPDLSSRILRSMERTHPFVEARGRRRVRTLRWASAAAAACVLLVGALTMRVWSNSITNAAADLAMMKHAESKSRSAASVGSRFFAGGSFADAASQNAAYSSYVPAGTLISLTPRAITGPRIASRDAALSSNAGRLLVASGPLSLGDTSRHETPLWRANGETQLARDQAGSGALMAAGDGSNATSAPLGSRVALRDRDGTIWTVSPSLLNRTPANASRTQAMGMLPGPGIVPAAPARFSPLWALPGLEGETTRWVISETDSSAPAASPSSRATKKPASR